MNEQIKQLELEAAYGVIDPNGPFTPEEFGNFVEKFAELIVRECVGVADDYVKDCMCDEHKNCKHPRSIIGRKIREHFGVEQ